MYELVNYRPGYAVVAPPRPHGGWLGDAHRVVRNAIAIGTLVDVPSPVFGAASDAVVAAENQGRYAPAEAAAVARLCRAVDGALAAAIDREGRLVEGAGAAAIRDEAAAPQRDDAGRPDLDRVFAIDGDGRVGLIDRRMPFHELRAMLPAVAALLERAAADGLEVELADSEPEGDDPFALHT